MTVRQRKGRKRPANEPSSSTTSTQKASTPTNNKKENKEEEEEEESFYQTLKSHWSIRALLFLGTPLLLYYGRLYLLFQKPHWLSPLFELRPAVSMSDPRQLLIIGTMSSGTSSISHQLSSIFDLEVLHESTDTRWEAARDGTVSWFHGIRYLNLEEKEDEKILQICHVSYNYISSPFHYNHPYAAGPRLFSSLNYECSPIQPKFKQCFFKECFRIVKNEIGCAVKKEKECGVPFQTTLFQTREPIRIAESLVAKYCTSDDEDEVLSMTAPPQDLLFLLDAILPNGNFLVPGRSCSQHMLTYVLGYYTMLLDAYENRNENKNQQHQIDAIYPIESTSLCTVAQLSGLLGAKSAIYTPNYYRVSQMCHEDNEGEKVGMIGKSKNVINKNRKIKIEQKEMEMYGLEEDIKRLYERLGYRYPF